MAVADAAAEHEAEAATADLSVDLGQLPNRMRSVDRGEPEGAAASFMRLPLLARFAWIADASPPVDCALELEIQGVRCCRSGQCDTSWAGFSLCALEDVGGMDACLRVSETRDAP